jgi:alkanesulfonate monooxygenase SsuD/methylene tetrahydromethanopterin reductase-like flavin-dependent oxidoreductase (luciferase family)
MMKLGFTLPSTGPGADPAAIRQIARIAEAIGYDSIWAAERELFPDTHPVSCAALQHAVSFEELPSHDPLRALADAAATTERVRIGVSVLNVPFHSPAMLARNLAALDARSNGRVQLGLGLGFSESECASVTSALDRNTPAAEFIQALHVLWTGAQDDFRGEYFYIPRASQIAQGARSGILPISLVAFAPAAVLPASTLISGKNTVVSASVARSQMRGLLREITDASARCPARMPLVVRADVQITASPLSEGRAVFHGSSAQVQSDIRVAYEQGVTELLFDINDAPEGQDLGRFQARMGQLYALAAEAIGLHAATA